MNQWVVQSVADDFVANGLDVNHDGAAHVAPYLAFQSSMVRSPGDCDRRTNRRCREGWWTAPEPNESAYPDKR